ncbi:undecaprenyl-diphosphate phosphatase [Kingella negevensis]|uniref:undecaprenyl-diphosphate phosphatase n=1 Tax=Kingella negevensis TaxID=1522312 RepID=UPI0025435EC4|nr:undecaprenyl-diphosphate phosphatase [Kingella negevensis]WII93306.1 undecaprenyl-diphosphate phosphatase [Kingella negevensis]
MDIVILMKALFLGIVEGITEFLPISSTGHLIVSESLIGLHNQSEAFDIVIQLGAILAVIYEYRQRFAHVITHIGRDSNANKFVLNLAIAFVPAAVMGLLFHKIIKGALFSPLVVATTLVIGGFLMLWIEKRTVNREPKVKNVDNMRPIDALMVGLAQVLALIPGTSRSGSTIMGGMLWGIDRKAATEFSFFLAVPMMVAASGYDIYKNWENFTADSIGIIAVGFVMAFISSLVAVKALLKFVSTKNYVPFAYYRIIFGAFIWLTAVMGWVKWD